MVTLVPPPLGAAVALAVPRQWLPLRRRRAGALGLLVVRRTAGQTGDDNRRAAYGDQEPTLHHCSPLCCRDPSRSADHLDQYGVAPASRPDMRLARNICRAQTVCSRSCRHCARPMTSSSVCPNSLTRHSIREIDDGDGGHFAGGVGARTAGRRRSGADAARGAVVVVSVPTDDPDPGRGRAPRHLPGPGRLRPLGQADADRGPHATPGTSSGCARWPSTCLTCSG